MSTGHGNYGVRYPETTGDAKRLVESVHPGARFDESAGAFMIDGQVVATVVEDEAAGGALKLTIEPRDLHG